MEENYEKRKSKLPILIGILSLVLVLSVGGVYAYFSARATNSGDEITGRTLDINGSTLTIAATRVDLDPDPEPVSDNLVPAKFGVEPTEMTTTQVNKALTKSCVVGGYTGCHVWKITASTTQNIPSANIKLNLRVEDIEDEEPGTPGDPVEPPNISVANTFDANNIVASPLDYSSNTEYDVEFIANINKDKSKWSYVVYTGTDSSATTILNSGTITTTFPDSNTTLDIHN